MNHKVVIVGCGNVGMSYAYALLNQKTEVKELVLIDVDQKRIEGEVMDLNHCLAFSPSNIKIKIGDYKDCEDAQIIVLCAGAKSSPGETRMAAMKENNQILKKIIQSIMDNQFKGIFLVATNPLDVMTYLTQKYSKLPYHKVIGTGTSLDSARLCYILGKKLSICPKDVKGIVIGEHGDSSFVPWSNIPVSHHLSKEEQKEIEQEVRDAAYQIIDRKKATYYGISTCLVKLTNAILNDENCIIPVSTYDKNHDIYIGYPCRITKDGIKEIIHLNYNQEEQEKLSHSIQTIQEALQKVE